MVLKRSSTYILTLVTALSLVAAGCSNGGSNKPDEQPKESTPTKETSTSEQVPADPLGKYEETVTVTEVLGYSPPEDPKTPQGLTPDKNAYLKDLKDQLNIEVKYLWTVPTDQYEQKFALSIASGDLPDVMELDARTFEKFKAQGILADLADVYEQYASPTLKSFIESDGGFAKKTLTDGDKLYGIPGFEEPFLSTQIMWIRTDWLKKANMDIPKSMDELEKVAEAFANLNSDKNGKTYGIAMQKNILGWGFAANGIFFGHNSYPGGWLKDSDGKLVAGEIQPETKATLERLQSWYNKGILDKEFGFKEDGKVVEDIIAGKVGIVFGEWWYPNWPLNLTLDKDPDADWVSVQIPSLDGKGGKSLVPKVRMGRIIAVNKKFKNPEAAVKMINFYIDANNKKNYDHNKPENGYVYNWFVPRIYNPVEMETIYTEVNKALENKQDMVDETLPYFKNIQTPLEGAKKFLSGDKSGWGLYLSRVAENGGWGLTRQIRDSHSYVYNEFYGTPTPTMVEKGAQLDKLINETFNKIIMGGPIGEFDKFVDSWKALGGNDITAEVNKWYEENAVK